MRLLTVKPVLFQLCSVMCLLVCTALIARADDLPVPTDRVLLTVTGDLAVTNDGDAATFDQAMLSELGVVTVETTTLWTDGVQEFQGVPLHALMERLGVEGGDLMATAINDYAIRIPMDDAVPGAAVIAFQRNGSPMSVRDKGPLWLIYPFDSDTRFQAEVFYTRSIWQLDRIHIVP